MTSGNRKTEIPCVEVFEYQRKSVVFWRTPFLTNDPPSFEVAKSHNKTAKPYAIRGLHEYKLPSQLTWEGDWSVSIDPAKTDDFGWMYGAKFDGEFYNDFKHCYYVRKRKYIRRYGKRLNSTQENNESTLSVSTTEEEAISTDIEPILTEHIVFEIETKDSVSKSWKPYQSLWFSQEMKSIQINSPQDIQLPGPTNDGEWLWAEGWGVIMPSYVNINYAQNLRSENNGLLNQLHSMRLFLPQSLNNEVKSSTATLTPSMTSSSTMNWNDSLEYDVTLHEEEESRSYTSTEPPMNYSTYQQQPKKSGPSGSSNYGNSSNYGSSSSSGGNSSNSGSNNGGSGGLGSRVSNIFRKKESTVNVVNTSKPSPNLPKANPNIPKQPSQDQTRPSSTMKSVSQGRSSHIQSQTSEDAMDDSPIIKDGRYDKQGWMYCQKPSTDSYSWKSTDNPTSKQIYRRRIWVRAAIWQPKTPNRRVQTQLSTGNTTTSSVVDSAEYFMAELLNALIWHVHLMSHERLVHTLPEEVNVASLDKNSLGKSSANTELQTGKHVEFRKRNEDVGLESESKKKETSSNYGSKIKSLVGFRSTPKPNQKETETFQRVQDVFFVDDQTFRGSGLSQLVTALKGLQFRHESFDCNPFADNRTHWGSVVPKSREGVQRLCEQIFDLLAEVLSECIFHSSNQTYPEQRRKKLFENFTEIANLYTALNEAKIVSNTTQLALLLDSYTRGVRRQGEEKSELNPLWIMDDLFHMKKKFAVLNLNHLEKLCLFFPDMLTNMKHVAWLIRHSSKEAKPLDELNMMICQAPLSRTKRIVQSWLKCMHDSVKPNVVTEMILLYLETCTITDSVGGKQPYSYGDYATFLEEYVKQSIDTAYMKLKELYNIASILESLSAQSNPEIEAKSEASGRDDSPANTPPPEEKRRGDIGGDEIKDKERGLVEYFREEKNRKQWWEYIEEIEMLFRDDAEISKALWQDGIFNIIPEVGMETLAVHFVTDITRILTLNSESLDVSYRILLAGSYRLQMLLQGLCNTYQGLEYAKAKEIKKQLVRGFNDDELELEAMPVGVISRRGSLNEMFGESAAADELRKIGESAAHQKVDQIFSFVQLEVKTRLQNWMDKSLGRTNDAIVRAASTERWQSDIAKNLDLKEDEMADDQPSNEPRERSDRFDDDDKVTWAHFVTDSFLFIDNEISAYFANIKGFPAEAMGTATQFFQHLSHLIEYILKIINTSFADIATMDDEGKKKRDKKSNEPDPQSTSQTPEDTESKENRSKDQRSFSSRMLRGITELADVNRRTFGIVYSTLEIVNHGVKAVKDVAVKPDKEKDNINEIHLLTDTQFKKELIHLCVKYSSISRIQEIISDLGPQLLRYIDALEEPKEVHLKDKFKKHRDELVNSAHKFVSECKEAISNGLRRGSKHISRQCLDVQCQHFFSFGLYAQGRIQSTTAQKLGLLDQIYEYLEIMEEYLRYKDLRALSIALANIYSRRMCEVLIGPSARTFLFGDNQVIEEDFHLIFDMFLNFNPLDFDEKRCPLTSPEHPMFGYYTIVEMMKSETNELVRRHVLVMTERVEQEEKKDQEKEKRETEAIDKKLRDEKFLKKEDQKKLQTKAHDYHKMLRERHRLKKSHDHPTLRVLAHRRDEDAQMYVENFVQFSDKKQPLLSEFWNMSGILRVIVHSGRDIPAMNMGNTSDPYVKVTLHGMSKSTRVIRRTLTPTWQQALDFELNDNILRAIKRTKHLLISFEVLDWDSLFSHDFIGQNKIKIQINQENIQNKWLPLLDQEYNSFENKRGEILVSIEVENIWVGVKEVSLDEGSSNNSTTINRQSTQKKKKGFFGLEKKKKKKKKLK